MDLNRNQFFMAGLIVFLLGIQLRMVEAFVLNERATQFLGPEDPAIQRQPGRQHQRPPHALRRSGPRRQKAARASQVDRLGLVSVGSVLILHSLAMKKPGG